MQRVLVVANWSLGRIELGDRLLEIAALHPGTSFHLVVPVTQPPDGWLASSERCVADAGERLDLMIDVGRQLGISIDGQTYGDEPGTDPALAVGVATARVSYTGIVVSTFTEELSRWIALDSVNQIRHRTGLPVEHIECSSPHALEDTHERFQAWATSHGLAISSDTAPKPRT